jgi:L-ribulokinase
MTGVKSTLYEPIAANVAIYAKLYSAYKTLHDAFGATGFSGSLSGVMKELVAIRHDVRRGAK